MAKSETERIFENGARHNVVVAVGILGLFVFYWWEARLNRLQVNVFYYNFLSQYSE